MILPTFAAVLLASSGSVLPEYLPLMREEVRLLQEEQEQQDVLDVEDAGGDPFPSTGSAEETSDEFVTVRSGGTTYALGDVPVRAWFGPYVRDMVLRGIVTGYRDAQGTPTGVFGPERPVSVEELAKMAVAAAGIDASACPVPRNATAKGGWSASFVGCAEGKKFSIFSDATVDVRRPALRGEVVVTTLEAFGVALPAATDSPFSDVLPSAQFASAILRAAADGIVGGYKDAAGNATGTFAPDRQISRAEIAKVLSLAIQVYAE
ncbi:MAG: S-layer homology domain-containing protein [Candidatus Peribacteraceae bacterium]|nr:S-layer homology domain-containing protein [Candidatus Peribacteraceae bacterium]